MGFPLKRYIDKLFGGEISKMPEEEFAAKVAEIAAEPAPEPAASEEIPSGLSPKEMWEVYGVSHVRWETAGACPCEGCKKMDGAIYDRHMAQMVDDRRHAGCSCRWVPLYVMRGRQQKECSLPEAPREAFRPDFGDLLTRIHEAEKLFPKEE